MTGGAPRHRGRGRVVAGLSLVLGLAGLLLASSRQAGQGSGNTAGRPDTAAAPDPATVRAGYEPQDVKTTSIAVAMVIGVVTIAIVITGLFALLGIAHRQDAAGPVLTPQQTAAILPPGPPLQSDPVGDLATLRRRETTDLSTYRWLSPDKTQAVIPIERAMALLVGKPLEPAPSSGASP